MLSVIMLNFVAPLFHFTERQIEERKISKKSYMAVCKGQTRVPGMLVALSTCLRNPLWLSLC
jgi:hypothetical protein